ncbi:MAG: F0F1 ATP synthase subunit A [Chloroflexi bacterium]|nr:F0F1 ATP synthase subunit A [Chloroflexota bacterium]
MSSRNKVLVIALAFIGVAVAQKIFIPFETPAVSASVAVKPETLFDLNGFEITNTLLTSWIAMLVLIGLAVTATRNMKLVPTGVQNIFEMLIEAILNLAESVGGERGRKFFPVAATILLLVVVSNLLGLIPGFGPIGLISLEKGHAAPAGIVTFDIPQIFFVEEHEPGAPILLAPFVRSPSTDINFPLSLALISVVLTQIFGVQALGFFGYVGKFINVRRMGKFLGGALRGKAVVGDLMYGLLDIFVGLIELVSEIGKILSFTFRLFGNIFAGEVVLLIMSFLFLALPLIFYGLEVFVGAIQGFVFCVLTLAFMSIATTPHHSEEQH